MSFTSIKYLVFLALAAIAYYITPKKLQNAVLLLASLVFYMWAVPEYGILVLFTVGLCYGAGLFVEKHPGKSAKAVFAAAAIWAGFYLTENAATDSYWLLPFGVMPWGLVTADYFPLLPYLGFFLLGAVLGKLLYRKKESLLPGVNEKNPIVAVLCWCGRNSLWIYLAHQPLLVGILTLATKE